MSARLFAVAYDLVGVIERDEDHAALLRAASQVNQALTAIEQDRHECTVTASFDAAGAAVVFRHHSHDEGERCPLPLDGRGVDAVREVAARRVSQRLWGHTGAHVSDQAIDEEVARWSASDSVAFITEEGWRP